MPKVTGPAFSLAASKSLKKTLTYQKRPSGHAVYPHEKPGGREPFTPSPKQTAQRSHIGELVARWQALAAATKELWDTAAEGAGYIGTGYHFFIHKDGVYLDLPPAPVGPWLLLETGDVILLETGEKILLDE